MLGKEELLRRLPYSREELAAALPWVCVQESPPSLGTCAAGGEGSRVGAAPSRTGSGSTQCQEKDRAAARRDEGAHAEQDPPGASRAAGDDTPPPPWTRATATTLEFIHRRACRQVR